MGGDQLAAVANLNVDGVLLLKKLSGVEQMPAVLGLFPNVYHDFDQAQVDAMVLPALQEAGLVDENRFVHPSVAGWMRTLEAPDIEATMRIMRGKQMLRLSLVRRGDDHVVAMRLDDEIVIQPLRSSDEPPLQVVAKALWSALGAEMPAARFETVTAELEKFKQLAATVPPGKSERALQGLGADRRAAAILNEASQYGGRRTELEVTAYELTGAMKPNCGIGILDTRQGRVIAAPFERQGKIYSSFCSGTYQRFHRALVDLVAMLPAKTWTEPRVH